MIVLHEAGPGTLKPIEGNPTLTSRDGKQRAPLATILSETWTDAQRAAFGIYFADPEGVPDGHRAVGEPTYAIRKGKAVQVRKTEKVTDAMRLESVLADLHKIKDRLPQGTVVVAGLEYPVLLSEDGITTGCVTQSWETWANYNDRDLIKLDGKAAPKFHAAHRDTLMKLAGKL